MIVQNDKALDIADWDLWDDWGLLYGCAAADTILNFTGRTDTDGL